VSGEPDRQVDRMQASQVAPWRPPDPFFGARRGLGELDESRARGERTLNEAFVPYLDRHIVGVAAQVLGEWAKARLGMPWLSWNRRVVGSKKVIVRGRGGT